MVSLVLDVNGLSTCMAHPLTEDAHLREGEAGVFLFRDLLYPLPLRRNRMESSAQELLAPIPTITAGVSDPLAVDQGVGEDGGLWVRRNLLVLLRTIRRTAVVSVLAGPSRRHYRVELSVSDDRCAARRS